MPKAGISVLSQVFYFTEPFKWPGLEAHRPQSAVQLEDLAADLGHFPGEPGPDLWRSLEIQRGGKIPMASNGNIWCSKKNVFFIILGQFFGENDI